MEINTNVLIFIGLLVVVTFAAGLIRKYRAGKKARKSRPPQSPRPDLPGGRDPHETDKRPDNPLGRY